MEIIEPMDWTKLRDSLPPPEYLVDLLVPASGYTLLHGPPGCGKSAFIWNLLNAIEAGSDAFGLGTKKAPTLFITVDMNLHSIAHRWGKNFTPNFPFVVSPKFDIISPKWQANPLRNMVAEYVARNKTQLVAIDALGGIHNEHSAKEDEVAEQVATNLAVWLPNCAVLINHHDRKARYGQDGKPLPPSDEDFLGSQKWRGNAVSQMHMWKVGDAHSRISHDKSQVGEQHGENIDIYIDLHGNAEPWDEHRANEVGKKWADAVRDAGLDSERPKRQNEHVASTYNVSIRTAERWRKLAQRKRGD